MKTKFLPFWATGILLSFSLLTSCEKDLEKQVPNAVKDSTPNDSTSVFKKGTFRGIPITYQEVNGQAILEGDIALTAEDLSESTTSPVARTSGAGMANKNYRWQNFTIPYEIEPGMRQDIIQKAIAAWEIRTPLDFVKRTNEKDYIKFVKDPNINLSSVGRIGGPQNIWLVDDWSLRVVTHEIGHAIGLFHEHIRQDREIYLTIHWNNIKPEARPYFNRWPAGYGFDLGSFDYQSVMMYGPLVFSQNNQPTMTRKDGQPIDPSTTPTSLDAQTVISMYANLYIVKGGSLFAVNVKDGSMANLGPGWDGAAKTLAEDDRYIWGMQGLNLWKTNRFNGAYEKVGNGYWENPVGVTGKDPQGNLYAQQGIRLWKIDKYGNHTRLGGPQALENWSGTQAIYYHKNYVYMIWKNVLYKINTTTGKPEMNITGQSWYDVKGIAAMDGTSDEIYVLRGDQLFRVNVATGAVTGGAVFPGTTLMTGYSGKLYLISGTKLFSVNVYGEKQSIGSGFQGSTSIGATTNPALLQ
ncbi:M12 family metallopeptidase [Adhaeribacter pallidiroseus]|uniref:Meprin A n=1 Tax=Adhaeribacter pallidiroseus TaxID=2072847 RepID=A0A369QMT7_9BACT|nr:M12 family metallopeptidase [Adhaeribacter pallidiroseus]RDC66243.1 Meprin A [Adhaeribacter pallidiroseus]